MAHFKTLVLLPPNTSDIEKKVIDLISPYYSELKVEPYKEYLNRVQVEKEVKYLSNLPRENIEKLAAEYEVSSDDLESLAKFNLDWDDNEVAGIDEYGSYRMTTINPQGKWDCYTFIEAEPNELGTPILYPCPVAELPVVVPYALVTPDGQWHEAGEEVGVKAFTKIYLPEIYLPDNGHISEEANWDLKVQEIIAQYPDSLAVGLNCHI